LLTLKQPVTTKIYARDGQLLYKLYQNENRTLVSLKDIPKHVIDSTIAIEDAQFYSHAGFSVRGILRAALRNTRTNDIQGGSTITQQLVKNTLLTSEKTYVRKLKELVLALEIENYFTKDEILSMYLNRVGYGGTAYGIEEAAQQYFGKSVKEVNLAEAALLAGLPAAPTIFSPFGAHPELAYTRQEEVLNRMVQEKYLSRKAADTAKNTPLTFARPGSNITAPHFVMYVKDILARQYGEQVVNQGGLEVTTSLDPKIQELAETVVKEELDKLQKMHVQNAAVLVTRPGTGEILAMVGSKDYYDSAKDGQVNVTLRPRQPGSSIKVITYTLALENDLTPSTILDDSPVVYNIPGSPPYAPKNYDGTFHGKVPLRQALASSYNVPAVKTLSQLGVPNLIAKAQEMGITTWTDPSRYGLSLTLGGGEVKMIDMAVVYGTLANLGKKVALNPVIKISDYTHSRDQNFACAPKPGWQTAAIVNAADTLECPGNLVVDPNVAYLMTDILSDNKARSPAFGTHSLLTIPGQAVAVKTGTTNNLRDNWTFGYTPDYLVAVWVGNNDNTSMSHIASGVTGASPIWNRIMTALLTLNPHPAFAAPPGLAKVVICPLTGTLTCPACPNPTAEYYLPGTEPKSACSDDQIQRLLNPTPVPTEAVSGGERDQILEGLTTDNNPPQIRTPLTFPTPKSKKNYPIPLRPRRH
jgi:1A family penicillin-binding protein